VGAKEAQGTRFSTERRKYQSPLLADAGSFGDDRGLLNSEGNREYYDISGRAAR
jgi:hypothetical protein